LKIILTIRKLYSGLAPAVFCACLNLASLSSFSQISSVNAVQSLSFGAFSQGRTGGTVSISPDGVRSVTGSVVPLNLGIAYYPALFEIEAPEGTVVSILNSGTFTLTGSNGGSMVLQIGNPDPASPFAVIVPPPGKTRVSFGGTLTVGSTAQNPPGNYSGSFSITFNNE